jgi:hypothetical protein
MKRPKRPGPQTSDFVLGLDLGQPQDYTALAVLERLWQPDTADPVGQEESHYHLRHLVRWPPRTGYPEMAAEVAKLVEKPPLDHPLLAIDQTAVGEGVVDLFCQPGVKAALHAVLITGGHETNREGAWHVPKVELVAAVQVLLQSHRMKFARLPERDVLVEELQTFKVKPTLAGNDSLEAWRERDHDDLVFAVALAAWLGEEDRPFVAPEPIEEEPGGVFAMMARGPSEAVLRMFNR